MAEPSVLTPVLALLALVGALTILLVLVVPAVEELWADVKGYFQRKWQERK